VAEVLIMTPGSISGVKPLSHAARFITLARITVGHSIKLGKSMRVIALDQCARSDSYLIEGKFRSEKWNSTGSFATATKKKSSRPGSEP